MNLSPGDIAREAAATGFPGETLEKVFRLMGLLDALSMHPFLKPRLALKGGTAINLFFLEVPRLSVDIDLNTLGPADRATMMVERPKVEQAVQAVCEREGLAVRRAPSEHAGGKWRLTYASATGAPGNLEIDVNFMFRTPLWSPIMTQCRPVGSLRAARMRLLDPHELAAGKLAALLARGASRDLFDTRGLLRGGGMDRTKLRLAFVVYGGINRKDWRSVSGGDLRADPREIQRDLIPMMRADLTPAPGEISAWTENLIADCRDLLAAVLPLAPNELEFIRRLNDLGETAPEHLTDDEDLRSIIRLHPGLKWKAMNVRKHVGLPVGGEMP